MQTYGLVCAQKRTENARKKKNEEEDSQVFLKKNLVEETGWMDNKGKRGDRYLFMLSKLVST